MRTWVSTFITMIVSSAVLANTSVAHADEIVAIGHISKKSSKPKYMIGTAATAGVLIGGGLLAESRARTALKRLEKRQESWEVKNPKPKVKITDLEHRSFSPQQVREVAPYLHQGEDLRFVMDDGRIQNVTLGRSRRLMSRIDEQAPNFFHFWKSRHRQWQQIYPDTDLERTKLLETRLQGKSVREIQVSINKMEIRGREAEFKAVRTVWQKRSPVAKEIGQVEHFQRFANRAWKGGSTLALVAGVSQLMVTGLDALSGEEKEGEEEASPTASNRSAKTYNEFSSELAQVRPTQSKSGSF